MSHAQPPRIGLIGAPGSGKSHLGRALADALEFEFIELDEIFWGPGWERCPATEFESRLLEVGGRDDVVIVGNYGKFSDLYWPRLGMLVWLDLPTALTYRRLLQRTLSDGVRRRETLPGCRQTVASVFEVLREGISARSEIREAVHIAHRQRLLPQSIVRVRRQSDVTQLLQQASSGRFPALQEWLTS